jgi:pyridoxal phosphate enzyme (YggS family)
MSIQSNLKTFISNIPDHKFRLIAVSKTHPASALLEAYNAGQRDFGENKVQEMELKQKELPADIRWHLIGHLQTNKVKYIAPYVHMIHSVDSLKLLREINKEAKKNNRVINCLLQIFIATEETKFGLSPEEAEALLSSEEFSSFNNIKICGLMGMASNTENCDQVKREFRNLRNLSENFKSRFSASNVEFGELSMGMSGDYLIALEEGATMIRVGSAIFGSR